MRALAIAALCGGAIAASAAAGPVPHPLPEETAELAPGPGLDLAQANCVACHSADYISTQPRGLHDPRAFWTAEVAKMRRSYGAPVEEKDVEGIVDHLVATYGR